MCFYLLETSVAWDKSIMKASCQFCHSGDKEDQLLLCDGCDKGYHTYCFKPPMDNIPDGDWFCYECRNKATGQRNCIVCGKPGSKNCWVLCDQCPKAYHIDCLQPPLAKVCGGCPFMMNDGGWNELWFRCLEGNGIAFCVKRKRPKGKVRRQPPGIVSANRMPHPPAALRTMKRWKLRPLSPTARVPLLLRRPGARPRRWPTSEVLKRPSPRTRT